MSAASWTRGGKLLGLRTSVVVARAIDEEAADARLLAAPRRRDDVHPERLEHPADLAADVAVAEDADAPAAELADAKLLGVEDLALRDPLALVARREDEARERVVERERDRDDVLGNDDLVGKGFGVSLRSTDKGHPG